MAAQKNVMIVGIDPALVDFTAPGLPPGMTAEKVLAALQADEKHLNGLGYTVVMCYTDLGETAEAVVAKRLKEKRFDCVLIGGGVRLPPANLLLFEKLINVVHEGAPRAKICFNTNPADSAQAVQRWI
jgi:hypothetical protein